MARTIAMQPIITLRGNIPTPDETLDIPQPAPGWVDALNFKDSVYNVKILELAKSASGTVKLVLETAASPAGPWTALKEYDSTVTKPHYDSFAATTGGTSTAQLERYVRWRIDTNDLAAAESWTACFQICVTVK